ncbi:MAG: ABC transporter permease [Syntrophales bacterium]|nr:ABC transporter permease [Syntrophales bacterium]
MLEKIGSLLIKRLKTLKETFSLAYEVLAHMLLPSTYNAAVRMVLVNQIYFTSVQILPLFLTISIILGTILIGVAGDYLRSIGMFHFFGAMIMGFVVKELAPFVTVLLIALRSGAAINTEIAVMKVNRELAALEAYRISVVNYLLVPRVLNGIVSIVVLGFAFSTCVLISGLLSSRFFFGLSFDDYISLLVDAFSIYDLVVMAIKCAILGFFIVFIPIKFGMSATQELTSIPIAVLNGMVQVFISIIVIEVVILVLDSLLVKLF